jgi:hypothetical protein
MVATKTANGNGKVSSIETSLPADGPVQVTIKRLEKAVVEVPIVGETPLIMHAWSQKSRNLMLENQQTKTKAKKEPRDPQADYEAAFYRLADGRAGMPATAFKAAISEAARFYDGITMTALKTAVFVFGPAEQPDLVPIIGEPRMREDTPRNANGVADLRYRPEFWPWSAVLQVHYKPAMLSVESIHNLVDASGQVGVGDWRPSSPKSKTGMFGMYRVDV